MKLRLIFFFFAVSLIFTGEGWPQQETTFLVLEEKATLKDDEGKDLRELEKGTAVIGLGNDGKRWEVLVNHSEEGYISQDVKTLEYEYYEENSGRFRESFPGITPITRHPGNSPEEVNRQIVLAMARWPNQKVVFLELNENTELKAINNDAVLCVLKKGTVVLRLRKVSSEWLVRLNSSTKGYISDKKKFEIYKYDPPPPIMGVSPFTEPTESAPKDLERMGAIQEQIERRKKSKKD